MSKRIFDIFVSAIGLIVLSPLFVIVALLIRLDSRGPVFFRQERIGKGMRPFSIYKFRTMATDAARRGGQLTFGEDPRITRVGRVLRKAKLDELPQLINVLKGEMSFVGPRPEVPRYVEMFRNDYEQILAIRPGITDLASLRYRNESTLLGQSSDPEQEYITHVLPDKLKLSHEYLKKSSLLFDLTLIFKTLLNLLPYGGNAPGTYYSSTEITECTRPQRNHIL
jgi:lipopolysaccharide/colanic/teichoic acid biosynthesis glycosyltransferase